MLTSIVTALMPATAAAPAKDTDHALVRASLNGDLSAFEALYHRHVARVRGVILRLCGGQRERADDLTQDAFLQAWRAMPSYRFESAFGTWLYRLAANTALMDLRSKRGQPLFSGDEDVIEHVARPDSAGHATALALDLDRAVASLPDRARSVLVLFDIEGWTHEEIANSLEIAVGSSKAQLHRARQLLRKRLEGHA